MADSAPGQDMALASRDPPCFNCGQPGHITFACPEPIRKLLHGVEVNRARQQANTSRNSHDSKRNNGPVITRYGPPPPRQGMVVTRYEQPPQAFHHQHGPPPSHSSYPPPPPPPSHSMVPPPPPLPLHQHHDPHPDYHGYAPGFAQYHGPDSYGPPSLPPPPQPGYGPPPFGQSPYPLSYSAPPHHGPSAYPPPGGPPGLPSQPPLAGPPIHYHPGQPPPFAHPPPHQYPAHPAPYSYPDHGPYPNPPAPDYPPYDSGAWPTSAPSYADEERRHRPDRNREYRRDDRNPRGGRRDRREDRRRAESYDNLGHRRDHHDSYQYRRRGSPVWRGRGDRPGGEVYSHKRSPHSRDLSRSRSPVRGAPRNPTPKVDVVAEPSDHGPILAVSKPMDEHSTEEGKAKDGKSQVEEVSPDKPGMTERVSDSHEHAAQNKGRQADELWRFEEEAIFHEAPTKHEADPIGEPLPREYKDDLVMIPPAYDALGVKSKYITALNVDEFSSSIRDTQEWREMQQHPAFRSPRSVTLKNLDQFMSITGGASDQKRGSQDEVAAGSQDQDGKNARMGSDRQESHDHQDRSQSSRKRELDNTHEGQRYGRDYHDDFVERTAFRDGHRDKRHRLPSPVSKLHGARSPPWPSSSLPHYTHHKQGSASESTESGEVSDNGSASTAKSSRPRMFDRGPYGEDAMNRGSRHDALSQSNHEHDFGKQRLPRREQQMHRQQRGDEDRRRRSKDGDRTRQPSPLPRLTSDAMDTRRPGQASRPVSRRASSGSHTFLPGRQPGRIDTTTSPSPGRPMSRRASHSSRVSHDLSGGSSPLTALEAALLGMESDEEEDSGHESKAKKAARPQPKRKPRGQLAEAYSRRW